MSLYLNPYHNRPSLLQRSTVAGTILPVLITLVTVFAYLPNCLTKYKILHSTKKSAIDFIFSKSGESYSFLKPLSMRYFELVQNFIDKHVWVCVAFPISTDHLIKVEIKKTLTAS